MAWRIHDNLMAGELDNTQPGRVTGKLAFIGIAGTVSLDLEGDARGALKGRRIRFQNPTPKERNEALKKRGSYMRGFAQPQTGAVDSIERLGDGTLHAAWYEPTNGRVVLELPDAAWVVAD
jgi:hypothetical protein